VDLCDELMSVADAKNRDSCIEDSHIDRWGIWFVDAVWAATENDTDGILCKNLVQGGIAGHHFAENLAFTDPAGNQLRVLSSKIQNDDKLIGWAVCGGRRGHYSDDLSGQFTGDSNA
jgi:hypothetical protein